MKASAYIHRIRKPSGDRFYLRPPTRLSVVMKRVPLGTDREEAERIAAALLEDADALRERVVTSVEIIALAKKIVKNAKSRGIRRYSVFGVSADDIVELYWKQRGLCAVSGLPFDLDRGGVGRGQKPPFRPSLDRIDNRRGYEPDNIRLVCTIANFGMGAWGEIAFLRLCRAVVRKNRTRLGLETPSVVIVNDPS